MYVSLVWLFYTQQSCHIKRDNSRRFYSPLIVERSTVQLGLCLGINTVTSIWYTNWNAVVMASFRLRSNNALLPAAS